MAMAVLGTALCAEEVIYDRLASFGDWGVFTAEAPLECWATTWSSREFGGDGRTTPNGDAQLFVMFRPFENRFAEVQYYANGRTLQDGYSAYLVTQELIVDFGIRGEWAWPLSVDDDIRLVVAMAEAAEATVNVALVDGKSLSSEFSLDGFAEAVTDAQARCAALAAAG